MRERGFVYLKKGEKITQCLDVLNGLVVQLQTVKKHVDMAATPQCLDTGLKCFSCLLDNIPLMYPVVIWFQMYHLWKIPTTFVLVRIF